MIRKRCCMLLVAVAVSCPATAHAHGLGTLLNILVGGAVLGLVLIAALTVLPFGLFYVASTLLGSRSPARAALSAWFVSIFVVVAAPRWVLPFSVRMELATMHDVLPGFRNRGFGKRDVPNLVHATFAAPDLDTKDEARAILLAQGEAIVPELMSILDSPDDRDRVVALLVLTRIGSPALPAIPRVIRIVREEHDLMLRRAAFQFIEKAAGWGDRKDWVKEALLLAIESVSRGAASGEAALALAAMKVDGAPALPELSARLKVERDADQSDATLRGRLATAIAVICTSLGDAARDNPDCR